MPDRHGAVTNPCLRPTSGTWGRVFTWGGEVTLLRARPIRLTALAAANYRKDSVRWRKKGAGAPGHGNR